MENITPWIEHLGNPLVLFGFALFLLAGLVRLFNADKLNGKSTERLMNKGLLYTFVVSILIVLAGFASSFMKKPSETAADAAPTVTLTTEGNHSPAINSGGDVGVVYSGTLSQQKKGTQASSPPAAPAHVEQTTKGEYSPAINSQGDVNVKY
jgi:hypothetical protein